MNETAINVPFNAMLSNIGKATVARDAKQFTGGAIYRDHYCHLSIKSL